MFRTQTSPRNRLSFPTKYNMSLSPRLKLSSLLKLRNYSTSITLSSPKPKHETRPILSLLKSETDQQKILDICLNTTLNPSHHLDRISLSIAISKLSQPHILHLLENYKSRPHLKTERFASHAIVLYGQAGMLDHAIRTFREIHNFGIPQSVKTLNALLFACFLAKGYNEVKRVFLEFPRVYGIRLNLQSFNTVIKAFCESGSSMSVYAVLAEMDRKGVTPNAVSFGVWIAGFYKEEKYEEVGKVLKIMKNRYGMKQNIAIYNIRIQSLCKLRRSCEAKALFDGMVERGVKPNSVTYCHLIHGFCGEGKLEEAKEVFRSMGEKGCQPDSECYFTFIYYLCQAEDYETALGVCKESIAKNWVPNFSVMKSLVNGLVKVSKTSEARELIRHIKNKFLRNVDLWNEVEAGLPQ